MRRKRATLAAAALVAGLASPAEACRLALSFALDVSASVDRGEYRQQIQGLASALKDPAVKAAVLGPGGGVAMSAYEWSGTKQQALILDWTLITTEDQLIDFSTRLAGHERRYGEFPTAVGYALGYGHVLMRDAPRCQRQVIDVSGDGLSNDGFGPDSAYRAFDFSDITVNGLVIGGEDLELIAFYADRVIRGPGAFIEVARDYDDYHRAMKRKLLREIGRDFLADAGR